MPVQKKNGQIIVCTDCRAMNNTCPKDDFPLPLTKLLVDAITSYEALSVMEGYSMYNQI